jgi:hypothetical protein
VVQVLTNATDETESTGPGRGVVTVSSGWFIKGQVAP